MVSTVVSRGFNPDFTWFQPWFPLVFRGFPWFQPWFQPGFPHGVAPTAALSAGRSPAALRSLCQSPRPPRRPRAPGSGLRHRRPATVRGFHPCKSSSWVGFKRQPARKPKATHYCLPFAFSPPWKRSTTIFRSDRFQL